MTFKIVLRKIDNFFPRFSFSMVFKNTGLCFCFVLGSTITASFAGTSVDDFILIQGHPNIERSDVRLKNAKSGVIFSHAKHANEYVKKYSDFYMKDCGTCHHNATGEPLTSLKNGDNVEKCVSCHNKPGFVKGKDAKGLTISQKREHHGNALMDNCQTCHKKINLKTGHFRLPDTTTPITCKDCHQGAKIKFDRIRRTGNKIYVE